MPIKSPPLICIGSTSWEANFVQSTKELVSLLAKYRPTLFVDYGYTWKDVFFSLFVKKKIPLGRIFGWDKRLKKVETDYGTEIYVLSLPPMLPINWINHTGLFAWLNKLNVWWMVRCINNQTQLLGWESPTVMNAWNPIQGLLLAGRLGEGQLFYYCYDEISAAKWIGKHGAAYENKFLPLVDFVVCSSNSLCRAKSKLNRNAYLVNNGVNFSLFHHYYQSQTHLSPSGPRSIGYIGTIDERIDAELITHLSECFPQYSIEFVGRVTNKATLNKLSLLPNLNWRDAQPAENLPKLIIDFSVCIIPFVKNKFTANIYPMKINEYLAMGKPVVLTEFADLTEFAEICSIATTKESFAAAIALEIAEDSIAKAQYRIQIASANSWEKRAESLIKIIEEKEMTDNLAHS